MFPETKMDPATDSLLEQQKISPKLTSEEHNLKPKVPGVKLDILNECQMFLKAEDGGGDAQMNMNENIGNLSIGNAYFKIHE